MLCAGYAQSRNTIANIVTLNCLKICNFPYLQARGVLIATGYGLDGRSLIRGRGKIFLSCTASALALGPSQPRIQWVLGAKGPGREADHSVLSTVSRLGMVGLCLHSHICLHGIRDSTFFFLLAIRKSGGVVKLCMPYIDSHLSCTIEMFIIDVHNNSI
jgi:hypothetical protein